MEFYCLCANCIDCMLEQGSICDYFRRVEWELCDRTPARRCRNTRIYV